MALLKFLGSEPRELAGHGVFRKNDFRCVPDEVAKGLVIARPDLWTIEATPDQVEQKQKKYRETQTMDKKGRIE